MLQPFLDFELELASLASESVVPCEWGRAFLSPSLPRVWDANWVLIERVGMSAREVAAAADEALAGFEHRTCVVADEDDGRRLGEELGAEPGWAQEPTLYMAWEGDSGRTASAVVEETGLAGCEDLRRELTRAELPASMAAVAETTEQLLEANRRLGIAGGDRWYVAPAQRPASACRLLSHAGIGQIEDVVTQAAARGQSLAQAVVLAALAASRTDGNETTFLAAAGDDWPLMMYEKLGFAVRGELTTLRRVPT